MPQSLTSIERGNPPARRKACLACIKSKRRCNFAQPTCLRCSQRIIQCRYRSEQSGRDRMQPVLPTDSNDAEVELVVPLEPVNLFQPVDSLTMSSNGAMLGDIGISLWSNNQPNLFNDFSIFDFDQMPPELAVSSPLHVLDSSRDVSSAKNRPVSTSINRNLRRLYAFT